MKNIKTLQIPGNPDFYIKVQTVENKSLRFITVTRSDNGRDIAGWTDVENLNDLHLIRSAEQEIFRAENAKRFTKFMVGTETGAAEVYAYKSPYGGFYYCMQNSDLIKYTKRDIYAADDLRAIRATNSFSCDELIRTEAEFKNVMSNN